MNNINGNYTNVNYDENNTNYRYSYGIPRRQMKFIAGISIFLGLALHLFLFYEIIEIFCFKNSNFIENTITNNLNDMNQFYANYLSVIVIIVSFSLVKTILFSLKIWHLLSHGTDEELENNKWMLILLGLSTGGLLLPVIVMKYFQNISTISSKSSKIFIVKNFGLSWLIGSIVSIILLIIITTVNNGFNTNYNNDAILSIIINYSILMISLLFSAISINIFNDKNITNKLLNKTLKGKIANFISYIFLIIISFHLILRMISAIVSFFESLGTALKSRNIFDILFSLIMESIRFIMLVFLLQVISATLKVLWEAQKNNGVVTWNKINTKAAMKYEERLNRRRNMY